MANGPLKSKPKFSRENNRGRQQNRPQGPRKIGNSFTQSEVAQGTLVMGRRCVQEVLRHSRNRIKEGWVLNPQVARDGDFPELVKSLQSTGRPVHVCDRTTLTNLVQSDSHQGVVVRLSDRKFESCNDWLDALVDESEPLLVLAVDAVQDPMNFGAMLRIAECFGVSAVVWSKNRSVAITPVVSKASVGASELVTLMPVANLQDSLERFKKAGFWVVAADIAAEATPLPSFEFPKRTVLVMGSEGKGIQPLIMRTVDFRVTIPMRGRVDSLNVSQATAVIVSAWCGQVLRVMGS